MEVIFIEEEKSLQAFLHLLCRGTLFGWTVILKVAIERPGEIASTAM